MPPKNKFDKVQIIDAALSVIRSEGIRAVTARSVSSVLDSSPKVIFGLFENMEELLHDTLIAAEKLYQQYIDSGIRSGKYPAYKASGMAYIRFASEEKELFKLLFMRDRTQELSDESFPEEIIRIIQKNLGFDLKTALKFHLEMWIYVHGIATMIATNYLSFPEEEISAMLTDLYEGMKKHYLSGH